MGGPSLLWALSPLVAAGVCRFTVRDIGFVDLTGPTYRLVGVLETGDTSDADGAALDALAHDGNVAAAVLDPAAALLDGGIGDLGPAWRGWALTCEGLAPLLLEPAAAGPGATLRACLRSPLRDEVAARCLDSFAVLLRVDAVDASENARLSAATREARADLAAYEARLPRPIGRPLAELTLARSQRTAERVLLWSLGLQPDDERGALCVLYGRGKLAGPVLVGDRVTRRELFGQLALVGESCECDAPRDWVRAPTLPLAWADLERARAAEELGFDPENPMIKAEVARILRRASPPTGEERPPEELIRTYRELQVEDPPPERRAEDPGPVRARPLLVVLVAFALLSLLAGAVVVVRRRTG